MPPLIVVLDANVLYRALERDLLLRLSLHGLLRPIWSEAILREVQEALERRQDLDRVKVRRLVSLLRSEFEAALVELQDHDLAGVPEGVHPDDRHVVAAARAAGATAVVTGNFRHFPREPMRNAGIAVLSVDDVLCGLLDTDPATVVAVIEQMADNYKRPPLSTVAIVEALARDCPRFAAQVRPYLIPA